MKTLYVTTRAEWRAWLAKNGETCREIWLVYYKKGSDKTRIPYGDAVEEAICFGWIDGKIMRLDEDRFAQRFSKRRPESRWSSLNIRRAEKMIAEGKMTESGRKVFRPERRFDASMFPTALPKRLEEEFKAKRAAWNNFKEFPPSYRRMTIAWVASAKKEETQAKRLNQLIKFSSRKQRIKFM
jgi:uncharacterized protein YdeI (YjbR/CyaY-like superfamily)